MTTKKIKTSDILGDNYYIYELTSSSYTPALNGTITITCTMKDVYGAAASSKSITLYQNGTSKGAKTTNSSGVATWSVTCSNAGIQSFKVENKAIEVFVDNKSDTGHTHTKSQITDFPTIPSKTSDLQNDSGFLTSHQDISNKENIVELITGTQDTTVTNRLLGTITKLNSLQDGDKLLLKTPATAFSYGTGVYLRITLANGGTNESRICDENGNDITRSDIPENTVILLMYKTSSPTKWLIVNKNFNGDYNNLTNKPAIPSKTSDLTNDSGFLTSHQSLDSKTVTVEKQSTAESGYAHTYVIKQNNTQVGSKINIPKDFLVKSATLNTCSTANNPVSGYVVGDKYLDFVINTKDNSATDEHLYILVSDLVDDITIDSALSSSSENPVQNKVIKTALDDKIDSSLTNATATGNNDAILCKTYSDGKVHTTRAIQANWVKDLVAHVGSGGIGSAGGDAQSSINTKINTALVNLKANKEDSSNKVTSLSSSSTDTQYPSAKLVKDSLDGKSDNGHTHSQYLTSHQDITGKEDKSNKVTSLSSASTNTQYPSAKCVFDKLSGYLTSNEEVIFVNGNNQSTDTTTNTFTGTTSKLDSINNVVDGTKLIYKVSVTSTNDTNDLRLSLGTNSGTIERYIKSDNAYTTANLYPIYTLLFLVYFNGAWHIIGQSNPKLKNRIVDLVYPIGSIYMSVNATSPATLFGGTWEQIKDTFLLASGSTYSAGSTGGSADATLVSHNHKVSASDEYFVTSEADGANNTRVAYNSSGNRYIDGMLDNTTPYHHRTVTESVGSSGTGKNMPPYIGVYMWKRIG